MLALTAGIGLLVGSDFIKDFFQRLHQDVDLATPQDRSPMRCCRCTSAASPSYLAFVQHRRFCQKAVLREAHGLEHGTSDESHRDMPTYPPLPLPDPHSPLKSSLRIFRPTCDKAQQARWADQAEWHEDKAAQGLLHPIQLDTLSLACTE